MTTTTITPTPTDVNPADIRAQFAAQRALGKRAKDAAEAAGYSEGLAVAAHVGEHDAGPKSVRLSNHWLDILKALEPCGPLLALTRNQSTVHEKTGTYRNLSGGPMMGLAVGEEIDLRMFFSRWHAAFAVTDLAANPGNRVQPSIQFFDTAGLAVHKIFVREATNLDAWNEVIARFTADDQSVPRFEPAAATKAVRPDAAIDTAALLSDWAVLKDTHDFFTMLKKHDVERQQSFRLAQGRFAQALAPSAIRELLQNASIEGTPIMCFVGNVGCIQIHSGPVVRIEPMVIRGTNWLNVIDPSFNLHLREDDIASVWRIEKPTEDGVVTSVEAFDAQGELMAMFFGARKPGKPELPAWRELATQLPVIAGVSAPAPHSAAV